MKAGETSRVGLSFGRRMSTRACYCARNPVQDHAQALDFAVGGDDDDDMAPRPGPMSSNAASGHGGVQGSSGNGPGPGPADSGSGGPSRSSGSTGPAGSPNSAGGSAPCSGNGGGGGPHGGGHSGSGAANRASEGEVIDALWRHHAYEFFNIIHEGAAPEDSGADAEATGTVYSIGPCTPGVERPVWQTLAQRTNPEPAADAGFFEFQAEDRPESHMVPMAQGRSVTKSSGGGDDGGELSVLPQIRSELQV